jgi:membrane-associated phospholipid phosphatase
VANKLIVVLLLFVNNIIAQKEQNKYVVQKPKSFSFITDIPKNLVGFTKQSFSAKNETNVVLLSSSTIALIMLDRKITDNTQLLLQRNGIKAEEDFDPFIRAKILGKPTNLGKIPKNINTFFYNIGQGSMPLAIAGGLYIIGKIKKDNRALQTSSQLVQSFIAMGFSTQLLKYATGRQNPTETTKGSGLWKPFPGFKNFQNNKPNYDAFPSGHLATLASAIAILHYNYPEKKWIQPVGLSLLGLVGVSMLNNGVHWSSDFPLGIALGYCYGKFIAKKASKNQTIISF